MDVARYEANAWGLHNMHGNMWEWCLDRCDWGREQGLLTDTYREGLMDPCCETGPFRVIRGGGWGSDAVNCRSASRSKSMPESRSNDGGFRVVAVPSVGQGADQER